MAALSFAVAVVGAACGSSKAIDIDGGNGGGGRGGGADAAAGASGADALAALEGIYTIDDVTLNTVDCSAEGPSVKATETAQRFFVEVIAFEVGPDQLAVDGCTDVASCENIAAMARNLSEMGAPWSYTAKALGPNSGGETLYTSPPSGGMCAGNTIAHATLTSVAAGTLRIEVRTVNVPTYPAQGGTTCNPFDANVAAAGAPCSRLKVITGTYEQAL